MVISGADIRREMDKRLHELPLRIFPEDRDRSWHSSQGCFRTEISAQWLVVFARITSVYQSGWDGGGFWLIDRFPIGLGVVDIVEALLVQAKEKIRADPDAVDVKER